jgi:hypothetical protein
MNDYRPSTPRAALGIAALAMTAATFVLFVFAPAMMESGGESPDTQMARATSPPDREVSNSAGKIILAEREGAA